MIRKLVCMTALLLGLQTAGAAEVAEKYAAAERDFRAASGTAKFFAEAYGYALFPTVGKGGIGVGGAFGKGRVYRAGLHTGDASVAQLSIGFQFGGQAYSQIIFFEDDLAYDRFTSGSFEFGAEASAVALTLGAQARAGTLGASASGNESGSGDASATGNWSAGVIVFTLARGGLMYEASIAGQKFCFRPVGD